MSLVGLAYELTQPFISNGVQCILSFDLGIFLGISDDHRPDLFSEPGCFRKVCYAHCALSTSPLVLRKNKTGKPSYTH